MSENKLIENADEIHLKDDQDLLQILGKPPGWFLRWGITVVFFAVTVLITAAWVIKFPDVVAARAILTTEYPPVRIFARADGKINQLLVQNESQVDSGKILAILENPADLSDINHLEQFLNQVRAVDEIGADQIPVQLTLGELQRSYAAFAKRFDEYQYFTNEKTNLKKIRTIRKQIKNLQSLNRSLENQKKTMEEVVDLAKMDWNRNVDLLAKEVASPKEVENAKTIYLQRRRELETLSSQVFNNNIEIEELNFRKMELKRGNNEEGHMQELALQEDLERMRSEIKTWKQKYQIVAPIAGKVSMSKIWTAQQFIKANAEVMTIVPEESAGGIIGRAILPLNGSGKVEEQMEVNIRLDGYPYQEFGSVEAKVKSISLVPENGQFIVELDMPEVLQTTYEKEIPFRQEMEGTANIITEDRRILERIFDKILSILKNR
ncbi:MAG: HlyD family efflux transporter periplasmic adaptor subunit [Bacteroidota bacterium]